MVSEIYRGATNSVFIAKSTSNSSSELVALKYAKTGRSSTGMENSGDLTHEAEVLMCMSGSKWVPKLKLLLQDELAVTLGMELCTGGDLMMHLERLGTMNVDNSRMIMYNLLVALGDMHARGFVHRDLKPDNIVFDHRGQLKLIDFGLTHRVEAETVDSVYGSIDYMAPEILTDTTGYSHVCDLWSAGIILYEMLFGGPPFSDEVRDRNKTIYRIINCHKYLQFPSDGGAIFDPELECAKDLIRSLLTGANKRPQSALGVIKSHPFFLKTLPSSPSRPSSYSPKPIKAFSASKVDREFQLLRSDKRRIILRMNTPTSSVCSAGNSDWTRTPSPVCDLPAADRRRVRFHRDA